MARIGRAMAMMVNPSQTILADQERPFDLLLVVVFFDPARVVIGLIFMVNKYTNGTRPDILTKERCALGDGQWLMVAERMA
jgi:hypothetical protein